MMVQGGHGENALAGEFERQDLNDDGDGFQHEQPADDRQHQFMAGGDRDRPQRSTQGVQPVSPMKTDAGGALYQRKPSPAPTSAPQITASSPVPGT